MRPLAATGREPWLETELETSEGVVRVIDFMPRRGSDPPRLMRIVEGVEPDDGIWESRGPRRHYTYSKVMAWVVFGPRDPARRTVRARSARRTLAADPRRDPRGGLRARLRPRAANVHPVLRLEGARRERPQHPARRVPRQHGRARHRHDRRDLGRPRPRRLRLALLDCRDRRRAERDEGQFLACSFWLVSALALNGRTTEASALFERLLDLRNDLGLLAEEYDVRRQRQVGNFPQAFSHLTLIGAATAIAAAESGASDA